MFERFLDVDMPLPLPFSNNAFFLSLEGKVFSREGIELIPLSDSNGNLVIELDWFLGLRDYKVALLLAFTFKPTFVPQEVWGNLDVMFKDGDCKNIHPSNLVWKFSSHLNVIGHTGFYYIPMFSRYGINETGAVLDIKRNVYQPYYEDVKGYIRVSVKSDIGRPTLIGQHRLMMLAMSDYPANVDDLVVNHLDGIKDNNTLSNFEWTTTLGNIHHAMRMGLMNPVINNGVCPVLVRDVFTNKVTIYRSKGECARTLGISLLTLNRRLYIPGMPIFSGGVQIKIESNKTPWRIPENLEAESFLDEHVKKILVRCVKTGNVVEYDSLQECGDALGISKDAVAWRLYSGKQIVCPDYKQYKLNIDRTPWRIPEDYENELLTTNWSKVVLVRNVFTGVITEYDQLNLAAKALGFCDASLTTWVKATNQPVFPGGYQYKLKSDHTPWRIPEDPVAEMDAYGTTKTILMRNVSSGEVKEFTSCKACAKEIGVLTTTLNWRLKSNGQKTYPGNLQFKYKSVPTPWA